VTGAAGSSEPDSSLSSSVGRFVAAGGIRVLNFGDESVVFNPTSWDAHLLNTTAVAVLDLLAQSPRSVDDVELFLNEVLLEAEQVDAAIHARRLLHDFEELGLAHRLKEYVRAGG